MKVSAYIEKSGGVDLDFSEIAASDDYLLTTEHAASSYGIPVAVRRRTGEVFGPAELIGELVIVGSELASDARSRFEIAEELRAYGFRARGM